nr:hypothetical protein [Tanacetum cinerariifolium]
RLDVFGARVASDSISTPGGGIGGLLYDTPLLVVIALASFLGFGMVVLDGGKNWFMNFETRSSHVRIDRGGSLSSQIWASPSRDNGKRKSLIVVLGTSGCLNVESEHNADFHPIVDFIEASPLRRNLKLQNEEGISSLPDTELFENLTMMSEGEAFPTDSGFIANQDRATIAKSSTLPHDIAPRVTSPAAVEGSMQQTINELTALCTSLQRQHSKLLVQFQAQKVEINKLNARVKILEDNQGVIGTRSADDASIKGRRIDEKEGITRRVNSDTEEIRMDEGEVAVERTSEGIEEIATVLTSIDAATVLARGIDVPNGSYSIPTAGPPVVDIHTGSDVVPTASPIVATAIVVTLIQEEREKKLWWILTLQRNRGYKSRLMPNLLENLKSNKKGRTGE